MKSSSITTPLTSSLDFPKEPLFSNPLFLNDDGYGKLPLKF
nr:hypothetical protein [Enterococcus faecium]